MWVPRQEKLFCRNKKHVRAGGLWAVQGAVVVRWRCQANKQKQAKV
jgi:hypothetical protein